MKVHRWKTITALAVAASLFLAIGAAPSQAATPAENTNISAGLSAPRSRKLEATSRAAEDETLPCSESMIWPASSAWIAFEVRSEESRLDCRPGCDL